MRVPHAVPVVSLAIFAAVASGGAGAQPLPQSPPPAGTAAVPPWQRPGRVPLPPVKPQSAQDAAHGATDAGAEAARVPARAADPPKGGASPDDPGAPARALPAVAPSPELEDTRPAEASPAAVTVPRPRPQAPTAPPSQDADRSEMAEAAREDAGCAALLALGAVFEAVAPIDDDGGCRVSEPLEVRGLGPHIVLRPAGIMNCATAVALARWAQQDVAPAAVATLDGAVLTGVRQNSAYVCRRRNNAPAGRLSEHAKGNAVDVAGFDFDTRSGIAVAASEGDTAEAAFLASVRKAACRRFATVLGPGSNAAHADHLHFDARRRRGGYRICEL